MPRRIVTLNGGEWRLGQSPPGASPARADWQELKRVAEWLPATVPGNVRADLMRAGRLPDLLRGTNAEAAWWVDDSCWWLSRDLTLSPGCAERVHLVLRGVDYIGDLFLNGHHLDRHEGMFSPQVYELTHLLRAENRLAVRIVGSHWLPTDRSSPWEKFLNHAEALLGGLPGRFPHRRDTLKCQMSFGWDFAPALRPMGIWDEVYAVVSGEVFIRDVEVRQQRARDKVLLVLKPTLDALRACGVQLRCTLASETFDGQPLVVEQPADLAPGSSSHIVEIAVPEPRLWWPWDHGRPDLYCLTVKVLDGERLLDATSQTVGLRQIELNGWALHVNGQRIYARGANWVPADILPGRVTDGDYRELLALARQANMNMLRVWGGGLREKQAFYDLCDRLGILVWQEFPIACAFVTRYPRSPGYLRLVEGEARAIVRDLRHHPSLALWCGGNEFSPRRNAPLVAALQRAVAAEDPTRPFLPASPGNGDSHNWRVWHGFQPPSAYLDDSASFASEFGLQAPSDASTLRRFIPPDELWPPAPSWTYHGAGLPKLRRYAQPFLPSGEDTTLDEFARASQHAQAHGLQIAIEHYRRRKAEGCGGVLVWQLNEPWPAISWALIDFFRQPKAAYETVKRLFSPVLVSVEYPYRRFQPGDRFQARVWIVNDRAEALPGCNLEVTLWARDGQPAECLSCTVEVRADSAEIANSLDWSLPHGGGWRLTCRLAQKGQALASNEYDLAVCDDLQPTWRQRMKVWLRDRLLPA
jgi:beta-mannosidase